MNNHWRHWPCPFCDASPFESHAALHDHMRNARHGTFSDDQLSLISQTCSRAMDAIPRSACMFCDWRDKPGREYTTHVTSATFMKHLGAHLELLAYAGLDWTRRLALEERFRSVVHLSMNLKHIVTVWRAKVEHRVRSKDQPYIVETPANEGKQKATTLTNQCVEQQSNMHPQLRDQLMRSRLSQSGAPIASWRKGSNRLTADGGMMVRVPSPCSLKTSTDLM